MANDRTEMRDGDLVYPTVYEYIDPLGVRISLRDYFAAQAMQGMLSAGKYPTQVLAMYAYQMADAMLAEREEN